MRVITWNIHGAKKDSPVWDLLFELSPDIILLQEVGSVPDKIQDSFRTLDGKSHQFFDRLSKKATTKNGTSQRFSTEVLVKGKIIKGINLKSDFEWVNNELLFFKGNIIACIVELQNNERFHVVSVYSPAWEVDEKRIEGIDVSQVRLTKLPNDYSSSLIWMTEILWLALKNTISKKGKWIVGGDYNSSETFDRDYQIKHGTRRGLVSGGSVWKQNPEREMRDRMYALGFKECLLEYNGRLTPTFRHSTKQFRHQLDHLYSSDKLFLRLVKCEVGDQKKIFLEGLGKSLSDHLPIIADFENKEINDDKPIHY